MSSQLFVGMAAGSERGPFRKMWAWTPFTFWRFKIQFPSRLDKVGASIIVSANLRPSHDIRP